MGFGKSSKSEGKKKKEGKYDGSKFTWFETSVNGGVHVLQILKQVAAKTPIPYLTQAAGAALVIIQIAQDVKDNRGDFRRLSQDAAALVAAVIESQQKSDDPARWPGVKLENVVQEFVATLVSIAAFATEQEKRKIVERVMNSTADGKKIKEFRERLAQAMSRFELSAHLQTYDILRLMEPMMKEFVGKLDEDARIEKHGREQEIIEAQRLEEKRWEQLRLADRQTQAREAAERREKEREAAEQREHEREAVKARVQTILQILEEEESRKQLLEERNKKAQEEGAAEDHRMGLGSSKRRQTEPVDDHREFVVDREGEDEEEEEEDSRHYPVRQRKKNIREVAVKAGRPELGQKNRRQTEPAEKYREPVVEMESTEEEENRYEPVRERKKAREGVSEEIRRTKLGRKDRRQTEPASKNRKPKIESEEEEEEEEEESRRRPVKGRKKKAQEVAAKESRRVSKSRKHESEDEEETEEESESGSSDEESITKAAMASVAAKLQRKTKKKDDLQSQMGRFQVDPSWSQPPPSFGYQPWLSHPPQQFGGPPAGPNDWNLRNSKVSFSNDNNNYSTNYQSNNTSHSNQENVGNNHSVTNTKVKKTGRRY